MKLTKDYKKINETTYEYYDEELKMKVVLHFTGTKVSTKRAEGRIVKTLSRLYIERVLKEELEAQ